MLTILSENLMAGVALAQRLSPKKDGSAPALTCVRLLSAPGLLYITGANRNAGLMVPVGAKVEAPIDILVPALVLADLLKTVERGMPVTLRILEKTRKLVIERPGATSTLLGAAEDPAAWHTPPQIPDPEAVVTLDGETLREIIPQVTFAAATDVARPLLLTAHLTVAADGSASLGAADGFHLALREFAVRSATAPVDKLLLAAALKELPFVLGLDSDDDTVTLTFGANDRLLVQYAGATFWTQTQPGADKYPDLRSVIPSGEPLGQAHVSQPSVLRALRAVEVYARESANGAVLQFRPGLLALYAQSTEVGDTHPVLACEADGQGDVTGDVRRFKTAVQAMPRGDLRFEMFGPQKAVTIRPASAPFTYALMPMAGTVKAPEPEPVQMGLLEAGPAEAEDIPDTVVDADLLQLAEATYSADKIASEGRIKKPLKFKGAWFIATGITGSGANGTAAVECRRVVPRAGYGGDVHTDPKKRYLGRLVVQGKNEYVLTGQVLTIKVS